MFSIYELCQVLGINHPQEQSTCVGYTQKRPDCRNPVAGRYRSAGTDKLVNICDALARGIQPSMLETQLQEVAKLLICRKNHQAQAPAKAQIWSERLVKYMEDRRVAGAYGRIQLEALLAHPDHSSAVLRSCH
ncbi:hypothetical protein CLAIMM_06028 [Cladophialophora immunda]|nr:hypothetical protein CLAIMM_06028 [Cladophialophora immunda]